MTETCHATTAGGGRQRALRTKRTGLLARLGAAMLLAALASLMVASTAHAEVATRTLLLSQRFREGSAPASLTMARNMVALPGETEGFQLAVKPSTSLVLHATVRGDSDQLLIDSTRFLRVGFVRISKPTTKLNTTTGRFPDPLPPLTGAGLNAPASRWGGFVVLVDVPTGTAPGTYAGNIELRDQADELHATVPFQVRVANVTPLPAASKLRFSAFAGVSPRYARGVPYTDKTQLMDNLYAFLARYNMSAEPYQNARPGTNGTYGATAAARLAAAQALDRSAYMVPIVGGSFSLTRHYASSAAPTYLSNMRAHWHTTGMLGRHAVAWLWDEPGKDPEHRQVPAMSKAVHSYAPGVRTMITGTPREKTPSRRLCTWWKPITCRIVPGQTYSNRHLWDGIGKNDIDIWAVPTHRHYGRWTSKLEAYHKIDNSREMWRRIQRIRKQGKQVWTYSYFMATRQVPQRAIDGPPADTRLLMAWNAYENNRGWLVWDIARWTTAPLGSTTVRNPYSDPLSWQLNDRMRVNGEASLIYPGYAPQYGLTDPNAEPVSSLRMENLRDGIDDVNLAMRHRRKFGNGATKKRYSVVFGSVRTVSGSGFTWPAYSQKNLPARIETVRRRMIADLEAAA